METEGLSDTNVETLRQLFGVMETWYCTNLKLSLKWRDIFNVRKNWYWCYNFEHFVLSLREDYKTFPGKIFVFSYFSCKNEDLSILNKFSLKWIIMFYDIITVSAHFTVDVTRLNTLNFSTNYSFRSTWPLYLFYGEIIHFSST